VRRTAARVAYPLTVLVLLVGICVVGGFLLTVALPNVVGSSPSTSPGASGTSGSGSAAESGSPNPSPSPSSPMALSPIGVAIPPDANCGACHYTATGGVGVKPIPYLGHPLKGFANCTACHNEAGLVMTAPGHSGLHASDCLICHQENPALATMSAAPMRPEHMSGQACTDCHGVSASITDPNGSPHHSGQTFAPPTCQDCHNGTLASKKANHDAVKPACTACHTGMNIPPQPATCNRCHSAATFGTRTCTSCHSPSGIFKQEQVHNTAPNAHQCTKCHVGYQKHAGAVACTTCHSSVKKFHHKVVASPGFKQCTACHAKTHAGRRLSASKCAACHKGNRPTSKPRAQHSVSVNKLHTCSACHSQRAHASARARISCSTCHGSVFHRRLPIPTSSTCLRCHASARSHAVGFPCLICHTNVVHNASPTAGFTRL